MNNPFVIDDFLHFTFRLGMGLIGWAIWRSGFDTGDDDNEELPIIQQAAVYAGILLLLVGRI